MRCVRARPQAARRESLFESPDHSRQRRVFPVIREQIWQVSAYPNRSLPQAHGKLSFESRSDFSVPCKGCVASCGLHFDRRGCTGGWFASSCRRNGRRPQSRSREKHNSRRLISLAADRPVEVGRQAAQSTVQPAQENVPDQGSPISSSSASVVYSMIGNRSSPASRRRS